MSTSPSNCQWTDAITADFDSPNQIHVWKLSLFEPLSDDLEVLAVDEQERSRDFKNETARQTYLCSRLVLRRLVASYLNRHAHELQFSTTTLGKPFLCGKQADLKFNLSHSGNFILLAISPSLEVGVDIEQRKPIPNWERIASKVFNKMTVDTLKKSLDPEKAFIREWTVFEARQKLHGEGIFGDRAESITTTESTILSIAGAEASLCYFTQAEKPLIKYFNYCDT